MAKFVAALWLLAGVWGAAGAQGTPAQYEQTRGISDFAFGAEVSAERAHFYNDGPGCPKASDACRRRGYVVRGDVVVVTDAGGNAPFVKAFYTPNADTPAVTGWLRRAELRMVDSVAEVPASAWVGRYGGTPFKRGNDALAAELQVRVAPNGSLRLTGESVPTSNGSPINQVPSAQVDGPLNITAKGGVQAGYAAGPKGSCELSLTLVGPYLAVDASGRECSGEGGPRATFQGLYLRSGARPSTLAAAAAASPPPPTASLAPTPTPAAAAGPAQTTAGGFTIQRDTKRRMGSAYKSSGGATVTVDGCRADCAADRKCKAFEFRAGVPNESHPNCMLLDDPGSDQSAKGFTSGVRN